MPGRRQSRVGSVWNLDAKGRVSRFATEISSGGSITSNGNPAEDFCPSSADHLEAGHSFVLESVRP